MKPLCLSIGGLDPSGGAGIILDIKVFSGLGVHGFAVSGVLTAQSTDSVSDSRAIEDDLFAAQIREVISNYKISSLKIGLISASQISILLNFKEFYQIPNRIVDPIMFSTSGFEFNGRSDLLPLISASTLVLPNSDEARGLLGLKEGIVISGPDLIMEFKKRILCEAILLKGSHQNAATDLFLSQDGNLKEIQGVSSRSSMDVHGTGCFLSSAIAANLSKNLNLEDSIVEAKKYLSSKLASAIKLPGDDRYSFSF